MWCTSKTQCTVHDTNFKMTPPRALAPDQLSYYSLSSSRWPCFPRTATWLCADLAQHCLISQRLSVSPSKSQIAHHQTFLYNSKLYKELFRGECSKMSRVSIRCPPLLKRIPSFRFVFFYVFARSDILGTILCSYMYVSKFETLSL